MTDVTIFYGLFCCGFVIFMCVACSIFEAICD